jgi:hypothetical protein
MKALNIATRINIYLITKRRNVHPPANGLEKPPQVVYSHADLIEMTGNEVTVTKLEEVTLNETITTKH